ncbi:MAG: hypothetical protein M0Z98_11780 [Actinomycetales bacterium]|nr:hypothetical protein [Actinomycetales bacterium]
MPQSKRHPARRPQQRTPKPGHRNPAGPSRSAAPTPPASPARRWLVRHSAGPLIVLHRLPTVLVPILMGVLLVAGLVLPWPAAGLLLLVVAVFLGWLLALSWPIISWPGRIVRALAVLALLAMTLLRLAGKF